MQTYYRTPLAWMLPFLLVLAGAAPQTPKTQRQQPTDFQFIFLKSGIVIGDGPPPGWTDLILKATQKLESGDLGDLPNSAFKTAGLFKPFIVANVARVEREQGPTFRLTGVGLGLSMSHEGQDRVVSTKSLGPAGETLGFIERTVLGKAEEEQQKAQIIARTPTFALMATPARLKAGPAQKPVYLLYAMLVNPETGKLRSVVWAVDNIQGPRQPTSSMVLLNPSSVYQSGLDVEAGRILGAIPVSWEFAMKALPPGQNFRISNDLQTLSSDLRKIQTDPVGFEKKIRAAMVQVSEPPKAQVTRKTQSPH